MTCDQPFWSGHTCSPPTAHKLTVETNARLCDVCQRNLFIPGAWQANLGKDSDTVNLRVTSLGQSGAFSGESGKPKDRRRRGKRGVRIRAAVAWFQRKDKAAGQAERGERAPIGSGMHTGGRCAGGSKCQPAKSSFWLSTESDFVRCRGRGGMPGFVLSVRTATIQRRCVFIVDSLPQMRSLRITAFPVGKFSCPDVVIVDKHCGEHMTLGKVARKNVE